MTADYEKLGVFYLGKRFDLASGARTDDVLLYDSKDLTTHAVCVGMTGSGKTGLCVNLLEEAAIDQIPVIAIDPKGDIGNILLTFAGLSPAEFRPWIDESQATREGMTADEFAAATAEKWKKGLADWQQEPARISKLRESADFAIYTPGSNAGLPLTVLQSFAAPSAAVIADTEMLRDRINAAASGLLALLGIQADPVNSREHILISNILYSFWSQSKNLTLPELFRAIQSPPFARVGILDLETFFPSSDRVQLAMKLNNLLASPTFAGWLEGESLDVQKLLYTSTGKPRISVLSISHLSDSERMFFVTVLLNEILSWMRSQAGTSSLRAILYMDEVFGYFPPTANPPSKIPMLTLLKQARAFGLGVVLATQNPVDLDYKGLSNTGTWFLGRLQTERDKARVIEGLEGASQQAGRSFDRGEMEKLLASLGSRKFLMNNVHENEHVVFETRWALSYLRGPMTRDQIKRVMEQRKSGGTQTATPSVGVISSGIGTGVGTPGVSSGANAASGKAIADSPPILPASVPQFFVQANKPVPAGAKLCYEPSLAARAKLYYAKATAGIDEWKENWYVTPAEAATTSDPWESAITKSSDAWQIENEAVVAATFSELPAPFSNEKQYAKWSTALKDYLYRTQRLSIFRCAELKQNSLSGETEGDFRVRLSTAAKEVQTVETEKLKKKYETKFATLDARRKRAIEKVQKEKEQFSGKTLDSALSVGSTLLGALFGRKIASATNVGKATTAMRSIGRAASERDDIQRAEEGVEEIDAQIQALEDELKEEISKVEDRLTADSFELEEISITPKKTDIKIDQLALAWIPVAIQPNGTRLELV